MSCNMYTLIVFSVLYFLFGHENECKCLNLKQVYFLCFFLLGLAPSFLGESGFAARVLRFRV